MARKSNKTAHVLDLITTNKNKSDSPEDQNNTMSASGEKVFNSENSTIEISSSNTDAISNMIKDKLLEEIGEAPQKPDSSENTETEKLLNEDTIPKNLLDKESEIDTQPINNTPVINTESSTHEIPLPKTPVVSSLNLIDFDDPDGSKKAGREKDAECIYINVLESLVKDKVMEYMEQFHVCTCSRCIADTTALALTNLPSKYIVTDDGNSFPLLNYYRQKYATIITAELTKACLIVGEHPHHH